MTRVEIKKKYEMCLYSLIYENSFEISVIEISRVDCRCGLSMRNSL